METDDLQKVVKLKSLCTGIDRDPKESLGSLKELRELLLVMPRPILKSASPLILSSLYHFIKPSDKNNDFSFSEKQMETVVDTLTLVFENTRTEKMGLFFNIYAFLLNEIYDPNNRNLVKNISEEYKLSIINCMKVLTNSLSWDILLSIYNKDNAPKLSQILYISLEIAKTEQLRTLRIAAMECVMSISRVNSEADITDAELCSQIADVFMFFLPGLSSGLRSIALDDEKVGHKVIQVAIRAWGRIVNLLMKDYNSEEQKITITELQSIIESAGVIKELESGKQQSKWKSDVEIKEYIKNSKRTLEWYKDTDEKLQQIIDSMKKLSHHPHQNVRLELTDICVLLLENCSNTMPKSIGIVVEIIITLSEDDFEGISQKCASALSKLSERLSSNLLKSVLENLEENFYNTVNSVPRIFNGIDEREQLSALNLLGGYLKLFGKYKLVEVLYSPTHLQHLILSLAHVCELERVETSLLEEYGVQDLEFCKDFLMPWKRFRYFNNDAIKKKVETLCRCLSQPVVVDIVNDCLVEMFLNDVEHRKEATFILNEMLSGDDDVMERFHIIKSVIYMYLEPVYWDVPTVVTTDEYGNKYSLSQVQNNVIQVCLQLEGIGKMALALGGNFQEFVLRTLYAVLEKAGSGQRLIKSAGLLAITNISTACGYKNVTELINKNSDYFSYHVVRKLRVSEHNESVLNVLAVVMKHSTIDVLPSISDVVDGVLMQSCDDHQDQNANAFLRVFNIFVQCLHRWLNIGVEITHVKSKEQKEKEMQEFRISNLSDAEDFSDSFMKKSAEEMYKEDMQKTQKQLDEEFEPEYKEYRKPDPPMHIKLTISILKRSLNFLPSKDRERRLLTLEVLKNGLEVVRDWEDELLPIVHLIWSPLVDRFKEFNEPLIINLSFQLLVTLARLSKDFIRSRTAKDVLPLLLEVARKSSRESFLKDKGSAYRYTQAYKLQVELLRNLARVLSDLDMSSEHIMQAVDVVVAYLSNKQPLPLQELCVEFFKVLAFYDLHLIKEKANELSCDSQADYRKNVQILLDYIALLESVRRKE